MLKLFVQQKINNIKHTHTFLCEPHNDISQLQTLIHNTTGLDPAHQILHLFSHNRQVRVIPGFSFQFYNIENHSQLQLKALQKNHTPKNPPSSRDQISQQKIDYMMRLKNKRKGRRLLYQIREDPAEDPEFLEFKQLLFDVASGKNKQHSLLIERLKRCDALTRKKLLDSTDKWGIPAVFLMINNGMAELLHALLEVAGEGLASVSNLQGWNCLLVAAKAKSNQILDMLLKFSSKQLIERKTLQGTVLHKILPLLTFEQICRLVFQKNVNLQLLDFYGQQAIHFVDAKHRKQVDQIVFVKDTPQRPPDISFKGWKDRVILGKKVKFFKIDAGQSVLMLYKRSQDLKFRPYQIILLSEVKQFQCLKSKTLSNVFVVSFIYRDKKHVYKIKNMK